MNTSNATYSVIVTGVPMSRFQGQVEMGKETSIAFTVHVNLNVCKAKQLMAEQIMKQLV